MAIESRAVTRVDGSNSGYYDLRTLLKLHANLERWNAGGMRPDARCRGVIRRVYVRLDAPRRYVHVGWICDACRTWNQRDGWALELGDRRASEQPPSIGVG